MAMMTPRPRLGSADCETGADGDVIVLNAGEGAPWIARTRRLGLLMMR